jgi:hypothetical protein
MGLFDVLRNFADKSGGEWIKENRHSTWIEIGDLFLNKKYKNTSYSKESCFQLANTSAACILRSADFSKLRNYYFCVRVDVNERFVRVMRIREENMHDKFIDESIFVIEDCFNVVFAENPNFEKHAVDIFNLAKEVGNGWGESWFSKM